MNLNKFCKLRLFILFNFPFMKKKIRAQTPKHKIIREPAEGDVEFLVAEIELPQIVRI